MKEKILKKAKEIFAKKGYELTSMEEIAKELGITKPAIYYHYKNKKTLYNEIFRFYFAPLIKKLSTKEKTLKNYIFTLVDFFENDNEMASLFLKELASEGRNLEDETIALLSNTIKFLSDSIKFKNPFLVQVMIMSTILTYLNTYKLRDRISKIRKIHHIKEIKEDLYEIIKKGIE